MKAISNSSVLIALSLIEQLESLPKLYADGIIIPQAVWREVVEAGKGRSGSENIRRALWITTRVVKDGGLVSLLQMELDFGEAESIALFREMRADVLLLDEKDARRVARRLGIPVLGTVGILTQAKHNGYITNLQEQLDKLRLIGGFRLSEIVYLEALRSVGER